MRNFLEKKRGQKIRIIFELNAERQPVHYYEGELIILLEDSIILRDNVLGEVAINTANISAVQLLEPSV